MIASCPEHKVFYGPYKVFYERNRFSMRNRNLLLTNKITVFVTTRI